MSKSQLQTQVQKPTKTRKFRNFLAQFQTSVSPLLPRLIRVASLRGTKPKRCSLRLCPISSQSHSSAFLLIVKQQGYQDQSRRMSDYQSVCLLMKIRRQILFLLLDSSHFLEDPYTTTLTNDTEHDESHDMTYTYSYLPISPSDPHVTESSPILAAGSRHYHTRPHYPGT